MNSNDRSDLSDFTDDFGDVSAGFLSGAISDGSNFLSDPQGALDSAESEGESFFDAASSGGTTSTGGSVGGDIERLADVAAGTEAATPATPATTDATAASGTAVTGVSESGLTDTGPGLPGTGLSEPASGTAVTGVSESGLTETAPRVEVPVGLERSLNEMGPGPQVPGGERALSDTAPGLGEHVGYTEIREAPVVDDTQVPEARVESSVSDVSSGAGGRGGEGPVVR